MKKILLLVLSISSFSISAQTDLILNLNFKFENQPFAYNSVYNSTSQGGAVVEFDRIQFYMSSINIAYDGGQTLTLTNEYVLTHANVSQYPLGSYFINNIEEINFDMGVDYAANHGNSSNWPNGHPLSPQTPLMDWGWPSGYFFIVIDGRIDDDNDGIANKVFQLRALGDQMLTAVNVSPNVNVDNNNTYINLDVNIDGWIEDLDLSTIGIDHSSSANNLAVCNNTNTYNVFSQSALTSVTEHIIPSYITIDYTMKYAPVLNYKFQEESDLMVTDIKGKLVINDKVKQEGNYFINKELKSGIYIATFSNRKETISKKFYVQR